jgi:hypothetical protein
MLRPIDQAQHLASGTDGQRVRRKSWPGRDVRGHVANQFHLRLGGLREQRDDHVFQCNDADLQLHELGVAERRSASQRGFDTYVDRPASRAGTALIVPALKRPLALLALSIESAFVVAMTTIPRRRSTGS